MESEDIARMCASMSLLDREGLVQVLNKDLRVVAIQRLSVSLVGKILSRRLVNREDFMRVIGKIWQVRRGVEIESVTGNIFSFHFSDLEDRSRVMSGAPWSFDNALLVLEIPDSKGTIETMAFNRCDFWVQIYQVPILCMTKEIGWFLGEMIGEVLDVDGGMAGDCIGKFMRIRVRIDLDNLMRRCIRMDIMGDGAETMKASGPVSRNKFRDQRYSRGSINKGGPSGMSVADNVADTEVQNCQDTDVEKVVIVNDAMLKAVKPLQGWDSEKTANINAGFNAINACELMTRGTVAANKESLQEVPEEDRVYYQHNWAEVIGSEAETIKEVEAHNEISIVNKLGTASNVRLTIRPNDIGSPDVGQQVFSGKSLISNTGSVSTSVQKLGKKTWVRKIRAAGHDISRAGVNHASRNRCGDVKLSEIREGGRLNQKKQRFEAGAQESGESTNNIGDTAGLVFTHG
ncbi:hypothetical protein Q3G72_027318 [Acer saccharum]|nr:hypothetical protein Q3G72_027318 [Acer saccharum]